jgi:hypothetical protein
MLDRILHRTNRFDCPDEHQLAAYVDQQLIGAERERVERHLAKCDSCLNQVGFLVKVSQLQIASVPSPLVHQAKKLESAVDRNAAPVGWKWMGVVAASAVIAMGLLLVWRGMRLDIEEPPRIATNHQPSAPSIDEKMKSEVGTAVRGASPPGSRPSVLFPRPGAIVRASDFSIRWEGIPNAAVYEVRIVTADGNLVWSKRVHQNSVIPPKNTLRTGSKYFVWVRAWLANGETQQSAAVDFVGG